MRPPFAPWLRRAAALALAALSASALAAPAEELLRLPSEAGAELPVLLDRDDAVPPAAAAVLFNGGGGAVGLLARGIPRPGRNFLVRSRGLFVARGVATAVIDVPTDWPSMSDAQRMSARHARDVAAVVAVLRGRYPGRPVYLVGTSRGTVSAAYAAVALGAAVDGVVLSSTVFRGTRGGPGLSGFDVGRIAVPLLLVHHRDDACIATPYAGAERLAPRVRLVTVVGGDPPQSDACEGYAAHGFFGVEAPVVDAMVHWMRGEPVPDSVP